MLPEWQQRLSSKLLLHNRPKIGHLRPVKELPWGLSGLIILASCCSPIITLSGQTQTCLTAHWDMSDASAPPESDGQRPCDVINARSRERLCGTDALGANEVPIYWFAHLSCWYTPFQKDQPISAGRRWYDGDFLFHLKQWRIPEFSWINEPQMQYQHQDVTRLVTMWEKRWWRKPAA